MIDQRQHIIGKLIPFSFETITVADTAIGLTASKLSVSPKPKKVFISVENAQLRYRMDGTNPEATVGHLANPMDTITLEGYSQLNNFKAIRKGTTSAVIQVTYLR
jgi:hypothetical protein